MTLAFQKVLENKKVPFKIFDFKKGEISMYKAIIGAILHNDHGLIIVPGESTSMISEITDILPNNKIAVYYNSVMNESHENHIQSEFRKGRLSIIDNNLQFKSPKNAPSSIHSLASKNIAKALYQLWTIRASQAPN